MKPYMRALVCLLVAALPAAAQQRTLVLEGGTVIDGTGKPPIADAVVVVEGNRIKAVGARGRVQYPAGADVVRLSGRTILPGFIDGHVHLRDYQRRAAPSAGAIGSPRPTSS